MYFVVFYESVVGGFGYSVLDCAYVLSAAGMMVYLIHITCMNRFLLILRSSPVRAVRFANDLLLAVLTIFVAIDKYYHHCHRHR